MTRILAIPAFLLCAFIAGTASAQQILVGEVTRVLDGDTFDVRVTLDLGAQRQMLFFRVRLNCVNAPEKSTPEGKALIPVVRTALEGHPVLIDVRGDGGFGRLLASVRPLGWQEPVERWLYREHDVPLYTGSQTSAARIEECRGELEAG